MSFWDKAAKVAKTVGDGVKDQIDKHAELKARLEAKSDDELKKIIKSEGFLGANDKEKNMARMILRTRGY